MGLFRRPLKCGRWGYCEQRDKRFLFGALLRKPPACNFGFASCFRSFFLSAELLF
jgi:hypothetical protein